MFGYGRVGYFMSEFSLILMLDKVLVDELGHVIVNLFAWSKSGNGS